MESLKVTATRKIVEQSWFAMLRVCEGYVYRELHGVLASELKAERAHRRFGASFTNGRASYRLSAELAAKLFVLQHILETPETMDVEDLGARRAEVLACWGIGAKLKRLGHNGLRMYRTDAEAVAGAEAWAQGEIEDGRLSESDRVRAVADKLTQYREQMADNLFARLVRALRGQVFTGMYDRLTSINVATGELGRIVQERAIAGHCPLNGAIVQGIDYAADIAAH